MKKWVIFLAFMFLSYTLAQTPLCSITNVIVSATNPQVGEEVSLAVTLVNKDFKNPHTITLKFLVDDTLVDVKVAIIDARSVFNTSFMWKAGEGSHTLTVSLSYFAPTEFSEKRDFLLNVGTPQKVNPLAEPLALFNAKQYEEARGKFVNAKAIFEAESNAEGVTQADHYIALCDKYLSAQTYLLSAEQSQAAGDFERAIFSLSNARSIYVELGEQDVILQIETRMAEMERNKKQIASPFPSQLLLYAGVVVLVIIAIFIYTRSREKASQKKVNYASSGRSERAPREDKIVFFDEGERGAPFIARCRKILDAEIPDAHAYMKLAEEFKILSEEFRSLTPQEAASVRKSYDMCAEKVASEEKKWVSIRELENLLRRCDSFLTKYSNKALLEKNMVDAYSQYTTIQAKFEELVGYDAELERKTAETLKKCYYLIEDEIHKMRQ